jgi:hypothetical protein
MAKVEAYSIQITRLAKKLHRHLRNVEQYLAIDTLGSLLLSAIIECEHNGLTEPHEIRAAARRVMEVFAAVAEDHSIGECDTGHRVEPASRH